MRRLINLSVMATLAFIPVAHSKPLVRNSETTVEKMCLEMEGEAETILEACRVALESPGLTRSLNVELLTSMGDTQAAIGDDEAAVATFKQALEILPENVGTLNSLGWSFRTLDREEEALHAFRTSIAIQPSAQGLAGFGAALADTGNGNPEEAVKYLDAALAMSPEYSWALREKGWLMQHDGQYEVAAGAFRQAIEINESDVHAHYGMARVSLQLKSYEDALLHANQTLDIGPQEWWYYSTRSTALRGLNRNALAVRDADRVIKLVPEETDGYVQKARAQFELGKRGEAFSVLEHSLDATEPDNFLYYWFAQLLQWDAQPERAMQMIDAAVKTDDANHFDHQLKASIALDMNDFSMALDAADQAAKLEPSSTYAHFYAALALVHVGGVTLAQERFDQVMRLEPEKYMLSDFASELIARGKFVEAIQTRVKYKDQASE